MNFNVTPAQEEYIKKKVASGRFESASEVVREAIRLLEEKDQRLLAQLDGIRDKVRIGLRQADAGEFDDRSIEEILADAHRHVAGDA